MNSPISVLALKYVFSFIISGTNATILAIWGKDAKPYLQALHLSITIGWTLSPQVIKPFLRLTTRDAIDNLTMEHDNGTMLSLRYTNSSLISGGKLSESHILYCYIIVASCLMVLSITSFIIVIFTRCKLRKISSKENHDEKGKSVVDGKVRVITLILLFCQSFMYGGIEMAFEV